MLENSTEVFWCSLDVVWVSIKLLLLLCTNCFQSVTFRPTASTLPGSVGEVQVQGSRDTGSESPPWMPKTSIKQPPQWVCCLLKLARSCIRQMAILCLFWLPQPSLFLTSTLTQLAEGSGFYRHSCNSPCHLMLQYTCWYLYVYFGCYFCQVVCVGRTDMYATCLACQKLQDVTAKMLSPASQHGGSKKPQMRQKQFKCTALIAGEEFLPWHVFNTWEQQYGCSEDHHGHRPTFSQANIHIVLKGQ